MKAKPLILIRIFIVIVFLCGYEQVSGEGSKFTVVDPIEVVKNMSPGWNLGNTLDATPTEGYWGIPPVEEYIFDDIKKAGFKAVRIPITWTYHLYPAPDYEVDPKWMDRVEEVVDWALERDFYVVINCHHDSGLWVTKMIIDPETGRYVNNYNNSIIKLEKLWVQIAERFKDKNEKLIFEIINEPRSEGDPGEKFGPPKDPDNPETRYDMTQEQLDDLNKRILKIIRSSGGNNDRRLVMICGLAWASEEILNILKLEIPDDEYIILTAHYYIPWLFVKNWAGTTTWGTQKDKKEAKDIFKKLYDSFVKNGFPVVIGEWGTWEKNDLLSKWYYHDYITKTAYKYGITCMLFDGGHGLYFDRKTRTWRDEMIKDITVNAGRGIPNSFMFPIDAYFKAGTGAEEDLTVKLELNGNQLLGIYNGKTKLVKDKDYFYTPKTVTIKKEYLKKLLNSGGLGTVATLRFGFSEGVDMPLSINRYDLPKFPESSTLDKRECGQWTGIAIPASFNGTKLAKVSVVDKENKKPIMRGWTPYIDMHDHFDYDEKGFILKKGLLDSLNNDTLFTLEFWPENIRVELEMSILSPYLIEARNFRVYEVKD